MQNPADKPFVWNDMFLLGYTPMDDTHREFVEIVQAILTAPDADIPGHLEAFARHAESHFEQERQWMESTEFPARGCHVDEHEAVMKSVRDVQKIVAEGDVDEARALAKALADWFPGHADYMDSALAHWMSKRSYGGKPVVIRRNVLETGKAEQD
jgi:hemerythrin